MEKNEKYVVMSLELHLFSARIMKEHALFLRAGSSPADPSCSKAAEFYKQEFENLLCRVIRLSDGIVSEKVLCSGEVMTEFTARAEQQTQRFTGICINGSLTAMESRLRCGEDICIQADLNRQVRHLNQTAIKLLDGLIALKENILCSVLSCKMFTMNYPLLLEHIIREAKLYRTCICTLEDDIELDCQTMNETELFWNQIMMEHAMFIRGFLDPSENELIEMSNSFAKDYARLLSSCRESHDKTMGRGAVSSLEETMKFRDFKMAGVKGIEECKIRSVILPLLADHVLREANHYIRLLGGC